MHTMQHTTPITGLLGSRAYGRGVRPDHKATNGAFSLDFSGVQTVVVVVVEGGGGSEHMHWVWVIYISTRNVI